MNKRKWLIVFIIVIILLVIGMLIFKDNKEEIKEDGSKMNIAEDFNSDLIRKVHNKENYLISPYSIEIALNMLREGAEGNTKLELDKVLGNRKINNIQIENILSVANGLFIKNKYKNDILGSYYNTLKNKYNSEILYDDYDTPLVINNWVNQKTNGMIPKILENIDPYFVLGLANAVSLDIKWKSEFECNNTTKNTFTKINGAKVDVEMMHASYKDEDYKYIDENDLKGIILPYVYDESDTSKLEFIALVPSNIDEYINGLTIDKLNNIDIFRKPSGNGVKINLSLPRFTYEYEIKDFIGVLKKMGINDVFDSEKADLQGIMKRSNEVPNIYVDTAIHKTKIELNETGTKAAAVTYFGIRANGMMPEQEKEIDIAFDKPFIYMIREKNTKEIIFFGSVYEPNIWNGTTCK